MEIQKYRGRKQVTYEQYSEFIAWYMKKCNIRVLKVKDRVGSRTVIDKKTKEPVAASYTKGMTVDYTIYDKFYEEFINVKEGL